MKFVKCSFQENMFFVSTVVDVEGVEPREIVEAFV